jgi:hypothetical protein
MITNNNTSLDYQSNKNAYSRFSEIRESSTDVIGTRLFTFLVIGALILGTFGVSWLIW